jgi:hypothetical protein
MAAAQSASLKELMEPMGWVDAQPARYRRSSLRAPAAVRSSPLVARKNRSNFRRFCAPGEDAHPSPHAALIYLHATRESDQKIATGMGKLFTNAKTGASKASAESEAIQHPTDTSRYAHPAYLERTRSPPCSSAVSIAAVSHVYHRHYAGLIVDAVDHPVGATAGAEPVVHRREKPFADPVRVGEQGAGDELIGSRRNGFRQRLT